MRFGIMQGRLSPPQGQELQFFPKDWEKEFEIARALGFEAIEWIFDEPADENPLVTAVGRFEIKSLAKRHKVSVQSTCADVFMKEHLTEPDSPAVLMLQSLLAYAERAEVPLIGIPMLEAGLPETYAQQRSVVRNLKEVLRLHRGGVDIALEIDLPAERILWLLREIDSPRVGVCYDTGNAMTHGFDAGADIRKLGRHLKEIHLKDRMQGTRQSVYLGEGSVNFPDVSEALREVGFNGLCILQAWRGEDYLGDAKKQLEYAKRLLAQNSSVK